MNGVETLRHAFRAAHTWFDGTIADVTEEHGNFLPPGRVHPISELVTHTLQSEDMIFHSMVQGQPPLWESEGWNEKLSLPFMTSHTQETAREFQCDIGMLNEYKDSVYASVERYFDSITDADLDREVDMSGWGMPNMRVGEVLAMFSLGNTFAHTGEISAIKGIQGLQGYPF